ncbi:hypothetical protein [Mesorhizobium sp. M9A.F.Ca.ET.002.03.1.2]|uniref:hypothetical protein n=1 Tax=Mesorhizobium sp. M9A.F.Ca.ET.002.03.1.2 TaxID=2493668 RepID=UPI0011E4D92C|nr:hypothetical protein [Mesorhizobium sp. M9A.F.Ca.ET.002.03.1.2]
MLGAPDLRQELAVRSDLVGMTAYGGMHVEQRAVGVENVSRMMHGDSFAARQGKAQAQIAMHMPLASTNLGHAG